jgi:hypothetical protein
MTGESFWASTRQGSTQARAVDFGFCQNGRQTTTENCMSFLNDMRTGLSNYLNEFKEKEKERMMTTTISSLQALNLVYVIAEANVAPGHADYMSKKEMAVAARRAYIVLEPIITKLRDAENEGKGGKYETKQLKQ